MTMTWTVMAYMCEASMLVGYLILVYIAVACITMAYLINAYPFATSVVMINVVTIQWRVTIQR